LSEIPPSVSTMTDPVFGKNVESGFRGLLDAIRSEGKAP